MKSEQRCGRCAHWESLANSTGRCTQTVTIENERVAGGDVTAWAETNAEVVNIATLITKHTHYCSMFSRMSILPNGWAW